MQLSKSALGDIQSGQISNQQAILFDLPEKVLQFGTGVLLRALPDYFINKANSRKIFNGRIVVVKSTGKGEVEPFIKQNCLYTVCTRGISNGREIIENELNSSISRVLVATEAWEEVLRVARNPEIRIIVSNTTEVGIQFIEESINAQPPVSFPAKLLAVLFARYNSLSSKKNGGFVIIPTELIPDNALQLKKIIHQLALYNNLEQDFLIWLENENTFCNSLVDRIVPGKPDPLMRDSIENTLGYQDELILITEVYRLWAIEGDEKVKEILSFSEVDEGVVIAPDITLYRELKLRMLNGTHTLSSGIAFLAGCDTVITAMKDPLLSGFIRRVMLQEIAPAIPFDVNKSVAEDYGNQVLERFGNPFLQHKWINITLQYSTKMKMRNLPMLLEYYKLHDAPPPLMVLGFAAYLHFMKPVICENGKYYGICNDRKYPVQDDRAEIFFSWWKVFPPGEVVKAALHDQQWWGADLSLLPGFTAAVTAALHGIITHGMRSAVKLTLEKTQLHYES